MATIVLLTSGLTGTRLTGAHFAGVVFAGNNFGDTESGGLAGPMGLLVILLLAIGTVLLIRNMNARLRRLPERFPAPGTGTSAGRTGSAADQTGPAAEPTGAGPAVDPTGADGSAPEAPADRATGSDRSVAG